MQIIKKFKTNDRIVRVRALSDDEANALFWVFIKNKGNNQQKQIVKTLSETIRDRDCWLECDCDTKEDEHALMTIALSHKDNYYLQHINSRGDHNTNCRFKGSATFSGGSSNQVKRVSKSNLLRLHVRGGLGDEDKKEKNKKSESPSSKSTVTKYPRLARFLYCLLEDARLNRVHCNSVNISDSYKALRQAARKYQLEKGIKASEFLFTYPDIEQIKQKLKGSLSRWGEARPYALCVAVASDIVGNKIIFKYKAKEIVVELNGILKKSSGRLGEDSKPYLVIFTVTDSNDDIGHFKPYNGFAVPVLSPFELIPVDSRYERMVLEKLKYRARWWHQQKLTATVIKPLFDESVMIDGELLNCLPDIVVETPKHNIVFEVMGSHEQTYIDRKERTTKVMRELGEYIEFDALEAEKTNNWDEMLNKKVSQLSALVFKGNQK
ncbi:hypothetical protein [Cysteiniphilum marinum]|uniref:hypothetical protein n=1 Tax=Cysteiniphilum marinum TaxID=2774191 RepID=UPI00193C7867|nr:hypothetical protein [Cysteiniphilum marinum]